MAICVGGGGGVGESVSLGEGTPGKCTFLFRKKNLPRSRKDAKYNFSRYEDFNFKLLKIRPT
jgi:hypothetical protein